MMGTKSCELYWFIRTSENIGKFLPGKFTWCSSSTVGENHKKQTSQSTTGHASRKEESCRCEQRGPTIGNCRALQIHVGVQRKRGEEETRGKVSREGY